jgi:tetratricopeptide (TPR) repeat protein
LEPSNIDAKLGLAQALAADGQYAAALSCYDELLKTQPENYEALQGKAFVLYWTKQFVPARTIFERLAVEQPSDPQNAEAVEHIGRAEEQSRWADLRPRPGAGLREFKRFYEIRLASYPDDLQALRTLADIESQLGDTAAAVRTGRKLTEADPEDADACMELALLLGLDGQTDAAMKVYRQTARDRLTNVESMKSLAGILIRANRIEDAISIYRDLAAKAPATIEYRLEAARLEASAKDYSAARQDLFTALSIDPQNWDVRTQLAQLELALGAWDASARHFAQLLRHDSGDLDAVFGRAESAYYKGDLRQALWATETLVKAQPDNFDAVFLLANVARARGRQRVARALLGQAEHLAPDSSEVAEMKEQFDAEPAAIVRTSIGYAREIGPSDRCPNPQGCGQLDLHQDLRTYSYGSSIETSLLPRTVSFFSFSSLPAASPLGRAAEGIPIPTGISGAVAPAELLYRQTTQFSSRLSFRSGAGLVKFGPGQRVTVPGQPDAIVSAGSSLLAQGGFSYATTKKTSIDLDFSRSPVTFTPTAVRLGVMERRLQSALNLFLAPRTELHMIAFYSEYSSERFQHSVTVGRQTIKVNDAVHQRARGGSVTFNHNLYRSTRFSFDGGWNSSVIAFLHPTNQLPLGFFTPDLFQTHLATARFYGHLAGPLAYDFSGGLGIQQTERGGALTRAAQVSPALTLKASNSLSVTLGYMHYNSAQSLGSLRGNAIRLTTEWKFK